MAYIHPAFAEFRQLLADEIRDIQLAYPPWQSTQWYLLRYLRDVLRSAEEVHAAREVDAPMRALTRFYVDQIEEGSALAEVYSRVLEAHRYAIRREETDDR